MPMNLFYHQGKDFARLDQERGKGHIQVHFAVNAVNYKDRKKRHENIKEVKRRGEVFHQIAMEEKA